MHQPYAKAAQYEPMPPEVASHTTAPAPERQYRDPMYAILFLCDLAVLVVCCVAFKTDIKTGDTTSVGPVLLYAAGAAVGITSIFAILWLFAINMCSKSLIWISLFFSVGLGIAATVFFVANNQIYGACICALFVALQCCWIYCVRHRIQLAATMLEVAVEVAGRFWGMYVTAVLMVFVAAAVIAVWGLSLYFTIEQVNSPNPRYGIAVFFLFSLYWIISVKRYLVHCTASGAFGHWYFNVAEGQSGPDDSATIESMKRACTTSFGSVCYGALIIAIIATMKAMARSARNSDNGLARFVACCLQCILQCIEDIIEYLNSYAFTHVAVFGEDYCTAVKSTMALFANTGWDAIINDDLIDSVLSMGCIASGLLGGGAAFGVAAWYQNDKKNHYTDDTEMQQKIICAVGGLLIGIGIMAIVSSTVVSCVKTLFVCFAHDPAQLYRTKPATYNKIMSAWQRRWPSEMPLRGWLEQNGCPRS